MGAPAIRNDLGRFTAGASGNPSGRSPKDKEFAHFVRDYLEAEDPDEKVERRLVLARNLYRLGKGDDRTAVHATETLKEWGYGKAVQHVEISEPTEVALMLEEFGIEATPERVAEIVDLTKERGARRSA